MARRPTPQTPHSRTLSPAEKRSAIDRLNRRIEDLRNFEPLSVQARRSPEVVKIEASIEETLAAAFGHGTDRYNRYNSAADLEPPFVGFLFVGPGSRAQGENIEGLRKGIEDRKQRAIVLLESAVQGLKEELEHEPAVLAKARTTPELQRALVRKVFIVHGHDEGAREAVARFLADIDFQPIILHEQASQNRTVIEKVEHHGNVGWRLQI